MAMSQSGLIPLPYELLSLVLTHLNSDTASLASLALVSRNLNRVITPTLYENSRPYEKSQSSASVYNFVHTILTRPDLARHVRHLTLRPVETRAWISHQVREGFRTLCRDAINKTFATWLSLVMPDEQRQIWSKYHGNIPPDTLQIILLCSLPNLETLSLDNNGGDFHICLLVDAVSRLANIAIPQSAPLLQLDSIRRTKVRDTREYFGHGGDALHECLEYFKLPNLIRLEFCGIQSCSYASKYLRDWTLARYSSRIRYLSVRHSHLSTQALTSMIETCAALEEFCYTSGCRPPTTSAIEVCDVLQTLQRHIKTLETLEIGLEPCLSHTSRYDESPLAALSAFKNLKNLTYSNRLMPLHNSEILNHTSTDISKILPPSLESVEVTHCDSDLPQFIQVLDIAKRAGHLPHLRRLRYSPQPDSNCPVEVESLSVLGVDVQCLVPDPICGFSKIRF